MYNLLEFFKLRTLVILQETYQEESDFIHRRNLILYDTLVYLLFVFITQPPEYYVYDMFNHASVYRT